MKRKKIQCLFIPFIFLLFLPTYKVKANEVQWFKTRWEIGCEEIINVIFTPGDTSILVTDNNKKIFEVDVITGEVKKQIPNINGAIQFSNDKKYLYTCNWEKVKWPTGEVIGKFDITRSATTDYGFSINEDIGLLVRTGTDGYNHNPYYWKKGIWIFDLNTFKLIDTLGFWQNYYQRLQMPREGKYFVAYSYYVPDWTHPGYKEYKKYVYDIETLDTIQNSHPLKKIIDEIGNVLQTTPDNKLLCTVNGTLIRVYDNITYDKKYELDIYPGIKLPIYTFKLTSDSRYMIIAGYGYYEDLHIFDLQTGELAYKYNNATLGNIYVNIKKCSSNDNYILGYEIDGLCLFNNMVKAGSIKPNPIDPVFYPNPNSNSKELTLPGSYFKTGKLKIEAFNINGELLKVLFEDVYSNQGDLTLDISFLPAGIYLLKSTQDNEIKTFKIAKGE